VEVDGARHADSEPDARRDRYLGALGFRVLRVWNEDVMVDLDEVNDAVEAALMEQGERLGIPWPEDLPPPSPASGRRHLLLWGRKSMRGNRAPLFSPPQGREE
jgi:hypothetical protein